MRNPYAYAGLLSDLKELWRKACAHDGVPPDSKFVAFSPDNPYRKEYDELLQKYWNLQRFRGDIKNPLRRGMGMWLYQPVTYIYIRPEDGKCVHQNAVGGIFGVEYEHDDPNWMPPKDWPYEVKDLRKKNPFFPDLLSGLALGAGWTTAHIGIQATAKRLKKRRK